jgi:hypothetical protein
MPICSSDSTLRGSAAEAAAGRGARSGLGGGRAALLGGFDVGLDHATVRTAAGDRLQVQVRGRGQAAGQRRGEHAVAGRRGGRRRLGRSGGFAGGLGRGGLGRFSGGRGLGGRRSRAFALAGQLGDRGVDLDVLGPGLDQDGFDHAFIDGFDFHRRLVGLDLGDHVAGLDGVADLDVPLGEGPLLHGGRQGGHQDVDRH